MKYVVSSEISIIDNGIMLESTSRRVVDTPLAALSAAESITNNIFTEYARKLTKQLYGIETYRIRIEVIP